MAAESGADMVSALPIPGTLRVPCSSHSIPPPPRALTWSRTSDSRSGLALRPADQATIRPSVLESCSWATPGTVDFSVSVCSPVRSTTSASSGGPIKDVRTSSILKHSLSRSLRTTLRTEPCSP